ncbi:anaerobic ribonucleoside-triphosphate reductase activating protein [Patescibacteria group bacterium]|nr:anaerobic ribonucleoside-triphosphate reductase activating protein [Patescibacteria group bacterium]
MIISGIQKTTLIDYPDKVAATVFLSGCNFRCPWCYSAELVLPEKIKDQPILPEEKFFEFLRKRQGLLDAIVLCGGEPTINPELPEFIKKIKKLGFLVKLDTNGSNPKMLKQLIDDKLIDYVAMDIKGPAGLNFQFLISNFKKIEESVEILKQGNVNFEFRTTVVPTIHTKENIIEMAKLISGQGVTYYLQNFRGEKTIEPKFEELKPYPEEYLEDIVKEISPLFKTCEVR